jgi:hypothetical protein
MSQSNVVADIFTKAIELFESRGWYRSTDETAEGETSCLWIATGDAYTAVTQDAYINATNTEYNLKQYLIDAIRAVDPEWEPTEVEVGGDPTLLAVFDWNDERATSQGQALAVLYKAKELANAQV